MLWEQVTVAHWKTHVLPGFLLILQQGHCSAVLLAAASKQYTALHASKQMQKAWIGACAYR